MKKKTRIAKMIYRQILTNIYSKMLRHLSKWPYLRKFSQNKNISKQLIKCETRFNRTKYR